MCVYAVHIMMILCKLAICTDAAEYMVLYVLYDVCVTLCMHTQDMIDQFMLY